MTAVHALSGEFSEERLAVSTGSFLAAGALAQIAFDGALAVLPFSPARWVRSGIGVVKLGATLYGGEKLEAWILGMLAPRNGELDALRSARDGVKQRIDDLLDAGSPGGGDRSAPSPLPFGLDSRKIDLAQKAFNSASVGATMARAVDLSLGSDHSLRIDPGTQLTASVSPDYLSLLSSPGIRLLLPGKPDLRLKMLRYDFRTASFDVSADTVGPDLFHLMADMGKKRIKTLLDEEFRPLLPGALRIPGYSPQSDPDLPRTIKHLELLFAALSPPSSPSTPRTPPGSSGLRNVSVRITADAPESHEFPLGSGSVALAIPKGTSVTASAHTRGPVEDPGLDSLSLYAYGGDVAVRKGGDDFLKLRGIQLESPGKFRYDYRLAAEETLDGIKGIFALLVLFSGQNPGSLSPTVLRQSRAEVDAKLDALVPAEFYGVGQHLFGPYLSRKFEDWMKDLLRKEETPLPAVPENPGS